MKRKIIIVLSLIMLLTGCFFDPYTNNKYGEMVIDSWFSYVDLENDLGKTRREVEKIYSIEDRSCNYKEKYKEYYIFTCTISYKEMSETIIPFSKPSTLEVYALFKKEENDKFTYKVYNSKSEDGIWLTDEDLK